MTGITAGFCLLQGEQALNDDKQRTLKEMVINQIPPFQPFKQKYRFSLIIKKKCSSFIKRFIYQKK